MMTRQDMEQLGHRVMGTYRGPLDRDLCSSLYNDLQQCSNEDGSLVFARGSLRIVSQDKGYNIVYIITEREYQQLKEM